MDDRIRLAEAMGWKKVSMPPPNAHYRWIDPNSGTKKSKDFLPDPESDANDDYAVLEWCRTNLSPNQFVKFSENIANLLIGLEKKKPFDALCISLTTEYQIGFYAKAALSLVVDE